MNDLREIAGGNTMDRKWVESILKGGRSLFEPSPATVLYRAYKDSDVHWQKGFRELLASAIAEFDRTYGNHPGSKAVVYAAFPAEAMALAVNIDLKEVGATIASWANIESFRYHDTLQGNLHAMAVLAATRLGQEVVETVLWRDLTQIGTPGRPYAFAPYAASVLVDRGVVYAANAWFQWVTRCDELGAAKGFGEAIIFNDGVRRWGFPQFRANITSIIVANGPDTPSPITSNQLELMKRFLDRHDARATAAEAALAKTALGDISATPTGYPECECGRVHR